MKRLFMLVLAGILAVTVATGATAAKNDDSLKKQPEVVEVIKLKADPTSEVILPTFEAIRYSDGTTKIHGKGSKRIGGLSLAYQWNVDLLKGTYKTTKIDDKNESSQFPTGEKSEFSGYNLGFSTETVGATSYTATVKVGTKDPVNITTAWTQHKLTWETYSDNSVSWTSRSVSYWVGQPTDGGTYWYMQDYDFSGAPYYPSESHGSVVSGAYGHHYNYDFGSDSERTDAYHSIEIEGLNTGKYVYDWYANHWGEYSSFLTGYVTAN